MRLPLAGLVIGLVPGLCSAPARADPPQLVLPSCVAGSPPLRMPSQTPRARLDAADQGRFLQAAEARYPLYRRGGGVASQVVLLQRDGHWQYAVLWPGGPTGQCLAATFAGDRFDFTSAWLAKYRPQAGATDD